MTDLNAKLRERDAEYRAARAEVIDQLLYVSPNQRFDDKALIESLRLTPSELRHLASAPRKFVATATPDEMAGIQKALKEANRRGFSWGYWWFKNRKWLQKTVLYLSVAALCVAFVVWSYTI